MEYYIYEILFNLKERKIFCENMDEPGWHYVKWNKSGVGKTNTVSSHLYTKSKIVKFIANCWMLVPMA